MDELDKDLLEQPYRRIQAKEQLLEQNYLLRVYENCYLRTYKAKYIAQLGNSDRTIIQDIRRMSPDKAGNLIEHYFEMKDKWFVEMRHSLEVLKRNLNKVNSDYEKSQGRGMAPTDVGVSVKLSCDRCGGLYVTDILPRDLPSKERVCPDCLSVKNPGPTL